jgi:anti-sigma-K factor RskA
MTHAEMDELYDLYALGVLEAELVAEIDSHVSQACQYCAEHVQAAREFTALLAGIAEEKQPPAKLRDRVLASVAPVRRTRNWAPLIAVLTAACIALLAFSVWWGNQMSGMRGELAALRSERNQLRAALVILSKSDTRSVQFGRAENVPHGRVFANSRGGVVFVGSQLPRLAANRSFELWIVPKSGAPEPAGVFRANASGDSVHISSVPIDPAQTKAVAVSVEPREGSSAPTTTPIIVVPLG